MQPFDVETPAAAVRTRRFVAPVLAAAGVVGVVLLAGPAGGLGAFAGAPGMRPAQPPAAAADFANVRPFTSVNMYANMHANPAKPLTGLPAQQSMSTLHQLNHESAGSSVGGAYAQPEVGAGSSVPEHLRETSGVGLGVVCLTPLVFLVAAARMRSAEAQPASERRDPLISAEAIEPYSGSRQYQLRETLARPLDARSPQTWRIRSDVTMSAVANVTPVPGVPLPLWQPRAFHFNVPRGRAARTGPVIMNAETEYKQMLVGTDPEACAIDLQNEMADEVDIWRDTPVRYCGYANEVGEALKAFLPGWGVPASYALAIAYVLADTADKANKEWKISSTCSTDPSDAVRTTRVVASGTDAITWQLLASVFVPGSVIHLVVSTSTAALAAIPGTEGAAMAVAQALPEPLFAIAGGSTEAAAQTVLNTIPTTLGLGTIPFIVEPIDETIHNVLDLSVRPLLNKATAAFARSDGTGQQAAERDVPFDLGGAAKGAGAFGAALAFPPTLFSVSGVIDALH